MSDISLSNPAAKPELDFSIDLDQSYATKYGNKWPGATTVTDGTLAIGFSLQDIDNDLQLNFTGFDVDPSTLQFSLNGGEESFIADGQNNTTSQHTITLSADELQIGENYFEFSVAKSTWKWGVSDISLEEIMI